MYSIQIACSICLILKCAVSIPLLVERTIMAKQCVLSGFIRNILPLNVEPTWQTSFIHYKRLIDHKTLPTNVMGKRVVEIFKRRYSFNISANSIFRQVCFEVYP